MMPIEMTSPLRLSPISARFLGFVMTVVVFFADWWTDPAINFGVFYESILVLLAWTQSVRWLWCWTVLAVGLVFLDLVEGGFSFTLVEETNHFNTICTLLITAGFVHFSMLVSKQLDANKESLRKAQDDLARVTRATSMGELAASIAHEVNQPLSGILVNCTACMRWLANVEGDSTNLAEARLAVERIIRDGKRAGDVITRLRNFFKKEDGDKVKISLNQIVEEVAVLLEHDAERKKLRLRTELDPKLPNMLGDAVELQQVILNLILNAEESMETVEDRVRRKLIIRTGKHGDGQIFLEVQDFGVGIEPEDLDKIYKAFYTTKTGGTGMGLSISRSIVEKHSGQISAMANKGPGTTFRCTFSLTQPDSGK